MKVVKQRVEVLASTPNIGEIIELAGRNCYKSEGSIKEGSAEAFVKKLLHVYKHASVAEHGVITVRLICDRGIMGQVTRHRLASYSIESTRYNNYSKGKFGKEITTIKPVNLPLGTELDEIWEDAVKYAEKTYMKMLEAGASTDVARSILPSCLKTDIVMTANVRSWRNFFDLRMDKHAHADIRQLSALVYKGMIEKGIPEYLFSDIMNKYDEELEKESDWD